jgi:hypothetical protein
MVHPSILALFNPVCQHLCNELYQWLTSGNASDFVYPQLDGSLRFRYVDSSLPPPNIANFPNYLNSVIHTYRITYYYGSKESAPAQSPDVTLLDAEALAALDSDGDGYTDLEEIAALTNPFDFYSKPTYQPLTVTGIPTNIELEAGTVTTIVMSASGGPQPITFQVTSGSDLGFGTVSSADSTLLDATSGVTTAQIVITINPDAPEGSEADIVYLVQSGGAKKKPKTKVKVVPPPPPRWVPQQAPPFNKTVGLATFTITISWEQWEENRALQNKFRNVTWAYTPPAVPPAPPAPPPALGGRPSMGPNAATYATDFFKSGEITLTSANCWEELHPAGVTGVWNPEPQRLTIEPESTSFEIQHTHRLYSWDASGVPVVDTMTVNFKKP